MVVLARDVLNRHPGAPILADVKASQVLFDEIARAGGRPVMAATGHSLIKAKLAETGAPLAGEMSGHIFFADGYYGFDDAVYVAVRLLAILSSARLGLADMRDRLPSVVNTPELRFPCSENRKFEVVREVRERLRKAGAEMTDIDGVRVRTSDGWWLLRASNTQAVLVARAESATPEGLARLKLGARRRTRRQRGASCRTPDALGDALAAKTNAKGAYVSRPFPRPARGERGRVRGSSLSAVAEFGVEGVAQRVAEEAEAEDGQRDREAREDRDPRRRRGVFLGAALQHQAPGRDRLLHAEAEIGERSFGEDRLPDKGGQEDQERRHHIGDHVAQDDPRMAKAAGARRVDIGHLADRQCARTQNARAARDQRYRDRDDDVVDAGAEDRDDGERHDDQRKGHHDIEDATAGRGRGGRRNRRCRRRAPCRRRWRRSRRRSRRSAPCARQR